ncbi:MAG: hypothetical protein FWE19_03975 [Oscillospiraceae bacterium]|nr:hypothetical protein [Oscillospiraceae bacterium]
MVSASDLIVIGVAVDTRMERVVRGPESPWSYTITSIRVSDVIYSNASVDQTIEVNQLGHAEPLPTPTDDQEDREVEYIASTSSTDYLAVGQSYLLFIVQGGGISFFPINPTQGHYTIDSAGNIIAQPGNTVEITIDMLNQVVADISG